MTISGANIVRGNAYTATFGGTTVPATFAGTTTLTATTPPGADTVPVTITNTTQNQAGVGSATFVYAAPTVDYLNVTSGPANQPSRVGIIGTNFTPSATVTVDGQPATDVTYLGETRLTATLPGRPAGTYSVRVTTGSVTTAANPPADQYTYFAVPTFQSITPNSGPTAGGTSVTITGSNLSSATAVTFGGTAAQGFVVNGDTQITAVTPPRDAGAVDVYVTNPGGTAVGGRAFTYVSSTLPIVTSQPVNQTIGVGATATFTASASGFPSPTVQWQVSTDDGATFTNIAGATSTGYTTPATTASDNGNRYRAVFANAAGSVVTNAATLVVIQPPTANSQSVTTPFEQRVLIDLTGTDPNTPARALTYSLQTRPILGRLEGSQGQLTYTPHSNVRGTDSFTFTVSNGLGTSAPATVSITITDPTLTITGTPPVGQRGARYDDFQFSTTGGPGPTPTRSQMAPCRRA